MFTSDATEFMSSENWLALNFGFEIWISQYAYSKAVVVHQVFIWVLFFGGGGGS